MLKCVVVKFLGAKENVLSLCVLLPSEECQSTMCFQLVLKLCNTSQISCSNSTETSQLRRLNRLFSVFRQALFTFFLPDAVHLVCLLQLQDRQLVLQHTM